MGRTRVVSYTVINRVQLALIFVLVPSSVTNLFNVPPVLSLPSIPAKSIQKSASLHGSHHHTQGSTLTASTFSLPTLQSGFHSLRSEMVEVQSQEELQRPHRLAKFMAEFPSISFLLSNRCLKAAMACQGTHHLVSPKDAHSILEYTR